MTPGRPAHLDHVVLAGPSLDIATRWFAERTGIEPAPGGSHPGWGTANYLVGLGGGAYLEIIGPDPQQPDPAQPRPFRVDELSGPTVVAWAIHPPDADAAVSAARAAGHDPGEPAPMSRAAPNGDTLRWRLTPPGTADGGLLPFLIDWGATPHPTTRDLPAADLVSLRARHPDPPRIRLALAALNTYLAVATGDAALELLVAGEHGPVLIR